MIVCKKCGNHNADGDEFCGSCGSFLEWTGERVEEPEPAAANEPTPVSAARPTRPTPMAAAQPIRAEQVGIAEPSDAALGDGTIQSGTQTKPPTPATAAPASAAEKLVARAGAASGAGGHSPAVDEDAPQDGATSTDTADPTSQSPPMPTTDERQNEDEDERKRRAAALIAPEPATQKDEEAQQPRPVEVKPAAPKAKPQPAVQPPAKPSVEPGDLICGNCGTGNSPERKFCRHCGASLATAVTAVAPTPWWQGFLPRRKPLAAGERPMRRESIPALWWARRVSRWFLYGMLGLVALLVLLTVLALALRALRNRDLGQVRPVQVVATSQVQTHPAAHAADGLKDTYWSEGAPGSGKGQQLIFTFEKPSHFRKIGFLSGASKDDFSRQPRPEIVDVYFRDASGAVVNRKRIELKDTPELQTHDVNARGAREVILVVTDVYEAREGTGTEGSLSEVEFWALP